MSLLEVAALGLVGRNGLGRERLAGGELDGTGSVDGTIPPAGTAAPLGTLAPEGTLVVDGVTVAAEGGTVSAFEVEGAGTAEPFGGMGCPLGAMVPPPPAGCT